MKTNEENLTQMQHKRSDTRDVKTKIMVVANRSVLRTELVELIESHSNLQVCAEAESVNEVLTAFEEKHIDFTIICTFPGDPRSNQLVNEIKFGCPNLPVLMLSMPSELVSAGHSMRQKVKGVITPQAAEQIIDAIYYVESLLKNSISGFAVLVNIETSREKIESEDQEFML
jgi:DNA-binding NarL/FixJ family response regulator